MISNYDNFLKKLVGARDGRTHSARDGRTHSARACLFFFLSLQTHPPKNLKI
jgi:hypothetical protein